MFDTNVLLDWLLDREPKRTAKIDGIIQSTAEIHIADVALIELVYVLESVYGFPRALVAANLRRVLNEPTFNCNRRMLGRAVSNYLEHPSLSIVDCSLLQYAQIQNSLPLWTSDKKLVSQGAGVAAQLR